MAPDTMATTWNGIAKVQQQKPRIVLKKRHWPTEQERLDREVVWEELATPAERHQRAQLAIAKLEREDRAEWEEMCSERNYEMLAQAACAEWKDEREHRRGSPD